jgi:AAA domain/PLD-like domain
MTQEGRPQWLSDLISIVQELCTAAGTATPTAAKKAKRLARVTADAERGAGWYWLGLAGRSVDGDVLQDAYLAPADGADKARYQLIDSVQDGNVLLVRAAEHAPAEALFLWIPSRALGFLEKSLVESLSRIDRFELIDRFAMGRTDPVPPGPAAVPDGLNEEQARAWLACCSPGVHLVWGPPGTGKTKVIALALRDLIAQGKRVLLVSATNIAVDNALARAAKDIRPRPGVLVRTGTAQLPEVGENPNLSMQALVRALQQELEQHRLQLEERISAARSHPHLLELAALQAELTGFELDHYRAAEELVTAEQTRSSTSAELVRLEGLTPSIAAAAKASQEQLNRAHAEYREADSARWRLGEAARLISERDQLASDLVSANEDVSRIQREALRLQSELDRSRRRFGNGHLKSLIKGNKERLDATNVRIEGIRERLNAPGTHRLIGEHRDAALPYTEESLARLDRKFRSASDRAAEANGSLQAHLQGVQAQQDQLALARRRELPTQDQRDLVARARTADLPRKVVRCRHLEQMAQPIQREVARLTAEYEQLLTRMRREGGQVKREIIRQANVVAATLAGLRTAPELAEGDFDFVIVDEVAAASPPEVVCAAGRALSGVTLLGDFMQNGPIAPDPYRDADRATGAVRDWYHRDCFAIFGITTAASAVANPGCVTLSRQYRFGRVINDLANAVAYHGTLRAANPDRDLDQDIVLIDVDGLGDELARARRGLAGSGWWWPVGAMLAKALAEHELSVARTAGHPLAERAGIVVPYRDQQQLIQDVIGEASANSQIEAGTSHRFQGREFDTVIFDLVEDGTRLGWIAKARPSGSPWELAGLRAFNVGITRARYRLYLIANATAVQKAGHGPLAALGALLDTGGLRVVRASEILGMRDAPAEDPVSSDIWHALRDHVTLIDLYDEDQLPEELRRRIDKARERVWLWSPWVGRRSDELLPHLVEAQDRGLRVHLVVLHEAQVNEHLRERHRNVSALLPGTVYLRKMHQKIIVIDHRLAFIGSMNVLAHPEGGRHEVMALFEGTGLVEALLAHERTDELARPPTCGSCGAQVTTAGVVTGGEGRLHWRCFAELADGSRCQWTRPFADRPGTRNQPRAKPRASRKP